MKSAGLICLELGRKPWLCVGSLLGWKRRWGAAAPRKPSLPFIQNVLAVDSHSWVRSSMANSCCDQGQRPKRWGVFAASLSLSRHR